MARLERLVQLREGHFSWLCCGIFSRRPIITGYKQQSLQLPFRRVPTPTPLADVNIAIQWGVLDSGLNGLTEALESLLYGLRACDVASLLKLRGFRSG